MPLLITPLVVAVLGLLAYVLASNPKLSEAFACGLLVTLFELATKTFP